MVEAPFITKIALILLFIAFGAVLEAIGNLDKHRVSVGFQIVPITIGIAFVLILCF